MKIKLDAIDVIKERAKAVKDVLDLKTCIQTPVKPVELDQMPAIFIVEGNDAIIKRSGRGTVYPVRRVAEINIDLVISKGNDYEEKDIYDKYVALRKAIIYDENGTLPLPTGVFIQESRTEGPTGYGLYDVVSMRLVVEMQYNDNGD